MRAVKTWRTWTTGELDRLEVLRVAGKTAPEIALALNRSLSSVKNRLTQEGIERPSIAYRRLTGKWYAAFRQPHTIAGLAKQFGVTVWGVKQAKRKLRRAGFEVPAAGKNYRRPISGNRGKRFGETSP